MVVDDQALVRAGFAAILSTEDDLEVVAEVEDGAEALATARAVQPDVVLMDIRMPRLDGISATKQLLSQGPAGLKVLMLTTFDLDEYLYEAMKAGASGFLLKDAPREQLLHAVRSVAAGDAAVSPQLVQRLIEDYVRRPPPGAPANGAVTSLTPREREVLLHLARGRTNAEIAGELFLGEATIRTHIGHIFDKLGVRDRVQAVIVAYESGLVTPGA